MSRVVIVDNGSSDGSATGIEHSGAPIVVIRNKDNRGFAAACNQAVDGSAANYVLFLNPDTRLFVDSLVIPVRFMEKPDNAGIGIVGIQLLDERGNVTPTCARFLTPWMVARKIVGLEHLPRPLWPPHVMVDWDHKTSRMVDHVMGAFFLVRRELFERLGAFDERFFVYLEDLDFSLRAKHAGFDSFYLADAQVFHRGGGASHQIKAISLSYALTSRILYGYKHFGRATATLLTLATLLLEPVSRLAFATVRGSPSQFADTIKAYVQLLRALTRWVTGRRPLGAA